MCRQAFSHLVTILSLFSGAKHRGESRLLSSHYSWGMDSLQCLTNITEDMVVITVDH